MNQIKFGLALLIFLKLNLAMGQEAGKIQLLLLGTYHMENPGQDVYNLEADDVLGTKRQAEVQRLIDRLAAFGADKVLLEYRQEDDSLMNARYQQYLSGATLSKNERQQLGFRLAKQLGHTRVYGADAQASFSMQPLIDWAEKKERQQLLKEMNQVFTTYVNERQNRLVALPIDEYLADLNSPEVLDANLKFYHDYILRFADGEETPGPDLVSNWYKRNARIMANILQTTAAGEKIILIFGSGHIPVIQQFARISDRIALVDIQDYLHAH